MLFLAKNVNTLESTKSYRIGAYLLKFDKDYNTLTNKGVFLKWSPKFASTEIKN